MRARPGTTIGIATTAAIALGATLALAPRPGDAGVRATDMAAIARSIQHLSGSELSMESTAACADTDPDDRPDHNDPASMNTEGPGTPEFATRAQAREWVVDRYLASLDPNDDRAERPMLHGRVAERQRAQDMLQVSTNAGELGDGARGARSARRCRSPHSLPIPRKRRFQSSDAQTMDSEPEEVNHARFTAPGRDLEVWHSQPDEDDGGSRGSYAGNTG